jgi:adenylate cyclase class 2
VGLFLGIEKVVPDDVSGVGVQGDFDRFARSLGVELERATGTYDSLVRAALMPRLRQRIRER